MFIKTINSVFIWLIFSQSLSFAQIEQADQQKAFPGADGAGKFTSGGRGGKVIFVDNLNDDGAGSLRAAIQQKGSRTIVFNLSGTIELQSPLEIKNDDMTLAGQSAPGDGICLKGYPLQIKANNIIIRYIRVRLGDISGLPEDAVTAKNQKNIIIDHCSFSWAVDECASFYDNENFTLQWCIISESLNDSVHPKGEHGYGGIWGGMNASFHHNLLAHHKSRLPRLQGSRYHKMPEKEKCEFVNNVIFNWQSKSTYGGEEGQYNLVGNYYKPGPATADKKQSNILEPFNPYGKFYLSQNFDESVISVSDDNWKGVVVDAVNMQNIMLSEPAKIYPCVTPESPESAYGKVLSKAGASKSRDEVDKRIIEEVRGNVYHFGDHGIIDSQEQVGGWPELNTKSKPKDSDHDGMADSWEIANHLDPNNHDDYNLKSLKFPFTNLEVYLNELVEQNH